MLPLSNILAIGMCLIFGNMPACITAMRSTTCDVGRQGQLSLDGTAWIVVVEFSSCDMFDRGRTEILAINQANNERIMLASFDDLATVQLRSLDDRKIEISLPNETDLMSIHPSVEGYQIAYRFLPRDDPEARANYQKFLRNPDDPALREWYRQAHPASRPGVR